MGSIATHFIYSLEFTHILALSLNHMIVSFINVDFVPLSLMTEIASENSFVSRLEMEIKRREILGKTFGKHGFYL